MLSQIRILALGLLVAIGLGFQFYLAGMEPGPIWSDSAWMLPTYGILWLVLAATNKPILEKHRDRIPWTKLRYIIPITAFSISGILAVAGTVANNELAKNAALFVNAPAMLLLTPIIWYLIASETEVSWEYTLSAATSLTIFGWYLFVRLLEWIAWRNVPPPSLNLKSRD